MEITLVNGGGWTLGVTLGVTELSLANDSVTVSFSFSKSELFFKMLYLAAAVPFKENR